MKRLQTLLPLLLCLCALSGCRSARQTDSTPAPLLVGYSQIGSESAYRVGNTRSMEEAAQRFGINLMLENANQKLEKQIEALRSFIAYRVDVITFAPIVETGWDNVLKEAKDAGIPVILVDRGISAQDETLYASHIGSDFVAHGRNAAQYLLRRADDMGAQQLNVVEISGTLGSTAMEGRAEGFAQVLDGDERFAMLESVSGDFLRSKGKECMRYLLDKYGDDIDVLFSHNDAMTLGAVEVIEAAGFAPGKDIIILTVDAEQAAIDLLKAGKVNCVVECTPYLGDLVMEAARRLAAGEPIRRVIHPQEEVFTDYDDLSTLAPRGY